MLNDIQSLLPGLVLSVQLLSVSLVVGLPLGLLGGVVLFQGPRIARNLAGIFIEIGRGFPALVTLYLVYFGLPSIGIMLDAFPALIAAFGYTTAAYTSDIFRSALASVPKAQYEAARALALSPRKQFTLVVLPQALRVVLPPLIGFSIIVFQATALAFSIGLRDLTSRAFDLGTLNFNTLHFMLIAAGMYLVITIGMSLVASVVQRRIEGAVNVKTAPTQKPPLSPTLPTSPHTKDRL